MSFLTRPHVVAAVLAAPVLAILGYIAVDIWQGEAAAPAVAGRTYELLARPDCRRAGGRCTLANADVVLTIEVTDRVAGSLRIDASLPLDSLVVAVVAQDGDASAPLVLSTTGPSRSQWEGTIEHPRQPSAALRVAATANGVGFFAQPSATFLHSDER